VVKYEIRSSKYETNAKQINSKTANKNDKRQTTNGNTTNGNTTNGDANEARRAGIVVAHPVRGGARTTAMPTRPGGPAQL